MPFKSAAQRKWMYANKPKMAKKWEEHTGSGVLPEHVPKKTKKQTRLARRRARRGKK